MLVVVPMASAKEVIGSTGEALIRRRGALWAAPTQADPDTEGVGS